MSIIIDEIMITCEITVNPDKDFEHSLELNTGNHSFDEVEQAIKVMIAELERKLANKENCPFYKKNNET